MIQSEMVYTKKAFNDFAKFSIRKSKETGLIYIFAGIILAISIAMIVLKDYVAGIIYAVLGGVFGCYGLFMKIIINAYNRKNIGTTDKYEFYDDKLVVTSVDSKGVEIASTSILYNRLYKAKKYRNYGYIYVNKVVAYIIDKNNFESEEQFENILDLIAKEIAAKKGKKVIPTIYGSYNVVPPKEDIVSEISEPTPPPEEEVEEEPDINEITDTADLNTENMVPAPAPKKTTRTRKTSTTAPKTRKPRTTKPKTIKKEVAVEQPENIEMLNKQTSINVENTEVQPNTNNIDIDDINN